METVKQNSGSEAISAPVQLTTVSPLQIVNRKLSWVVNFLVVAILTAFVAIGCAPKKDAPHDEYTCPMHPDIVKNEPGKCPVCGMNLVKRKPSAPAPSSMNSSGKENRKMGNPASMIAPQYVAKSTVTKVNGIIQTDTRRQTIVPARFGGRIEKLYLKYDQQVVHQGDKLLEVYSPDLLTAQQDLLVVLQSDGNNTNVVDQSKRRLSLLGMSEAQIGQLVTTRIPLRSVAIVSPVTGYLSRQATTKLQEGMYVQPGQSLFALVNSVSVWVDFDLRPSDGAGIKAGDPIIIRAEDGTREITARIDFVEPIFDADDVFAKTRVYLSNTDGRFLPGEFVTGSINTITPVSLWVPATSVLDLGTRAVVYVKRNGILKPREITIMGRSDEWIDISSGLMRSDSIASDVRFIAENDSFVMDSKR